MYKRVNLISSFIYKKLHEKLHIKELKEKADKGMTMVEVLMGFVVLMIFFAGMSGIIAFSSNMLYEAMDLRHSQEALQSEVYKKDPSGQKLSGSFELYDENNAKSVSLSHTELIKIESKNVSDVDANVLDVKVYGFKTDL